MIKHWSWFEAAALWLAACLWAGSALGSPGYLPTTGPMPVRFQKAPVPVPPGQLPPLLQPEIQAPQNDGAGTNAPVPSLPATDAETNSALHPPLSDSAVSLPKPPEPVAPPPSVAIPFSLPGPYGPPAAAEPPIDPVALLNQLLVLSTNGPGARFIMPVFIPPSPPAFSPSSHAVYESP
jgi:hypothetical protein